MAPAGNFRYVGHRGGMDLKFPQDEGYDYGYGDDDSDKALQANAIRPCGEDWILAFPSDKGNVCAQITRLGEINIWKVIDEAVAKMPCGASGGNCGRMGHRGACCAWHHWGLPSKTRHAARKPDFFSATKSRIARAGSWNSMVTATRRGVCK